MYEINLNLAMLTGSLTVEEIYHHIRVQGLGYMINFVNLFYSYLLVLLCVQHYYFFYQMCVKYKELFFLFLSL